MIEDISIHNITHRQIVIQIQDALLRVLDAVPNLSDVDVLLSQQEGGYDIVASAIMMGSSSILKIICIVKSKGEPQYIRKAGHQLLAMRKNVGDCYAMIGAPYISDESRRICKEMGIGCIDLSGNCMIVFKRIYVWIEGKPNKYKDSRGSKSIFERSSVQSCIILRWLLKNPNKIWKIQDLAEASASSMGQVSKVKKFLEEREYVANAEPGFLIKRPKELIMEWAKVYNSKPNTVYECYSADSIPQIEQKLIEMRAQSAIEYAITGLSGGVRYTSAVRYNKVHVYIPLQEIEEAIKLLGSKAVTSGSNISIIVPYDQCIMMDARNIKGILVASPVQVCLDLMSLKGRGEEAVQAIIEKEGLIAYLK